MSHLTEQQTKVLLGPVHGSRVHQVQGMSHMEAYDIRAHLNRIFGFAGWSADVTSMDLIFEQQHENKNGKPAVTVAYRAGLRLTIKALDGTVLATYTEHAAGDAQSFPTFKRGDAHDFAMKTAESQALKRAAVNLGDQFGLSLYNNGSLKPLVIRTLAVEKPEVPKGGIDHDAPEVQPEQTPEPEGEPVVSNEQPNGKAWSKANVEARIKWCKGDVDALRTAYMDAKAAGTDPELLELIKTAATPEQPIEGVVQ